MELSKFKKAIAAVSVAAIALTQAGITLAYTDVPSNAWYAAAVDDFAAAGYLDTTQSTFRPSDLALRAEFVKLIVELNGGILGTAPTIPSFNDVAVGAWYYGYMEEAAAEGWVRGDGDCYGEANCNARPGARINRAEAAALIVRAFGLEGTDEAPQFVDSPSGQWYTNDVQTAADNCILQGDDGRGTVRPGDNMNRAEMVVMLQRVDMGLQYPNCGGGSNVGGAAGIDSVSSLSSTKVEVAFTAALDRAAAEDVANYDIEGLTIDAVKLTSADTVEITFEESMVPGEEYTVFVSGLTTTGDEFEDSATFNGYTSLPTSEGTLEVSLNPNSPQGDTLPKGAVGIAMLSVDFTASCTDDIQVEGLTLIHEGQGSQADITNAWMSVNGARVSRTRIFDSQDQTADVRFSSPLLVEACETVTVDLMADFLSTAATNGRHNYVVELASDVLSNAKQVSGTFPVRGETFEVAAVTSGIITVTYRSVTPSQVDVNDTDVVIGKWEFSIDSTEDQTFYAVTLENTGTSSDGDFINIFVQRTDGTPLTETVSQSVGDYTTLTFDPPFTVLEGDKLTLDVVADIVEGAAMNIILSFEETNDVFAVGSLYGYGVNGQLYGSQVTISTTANASTVTINAGELTIDIDGPVTAEYTPDADDVVLANIDFITGGEDINVNEMYALILGETSSGATLACHGTANDTLVENLEDVEIRNIVTGQTVDGVATGTATSSACGVTSGTTNTSAVYRFDDFILRDSSRWVLRTDFKADVPKNGDKFQVFVCTADEADTLGCDFGTHVDRATTYNFDAEGLSTGDRVSDIRPGEDISGNFQEVATANLSIYERAFSNNDVVSKADNVALFRFEATAGKAEDVFVTQFVMKSDAGTLLDGTDYTLWVDSDEDGTVDTMLQSGKGCEGTCDGTAITDGTDEIAFDQMAGGGYTVPAGESVIFEVHADIAGSLNLTTLAIGFDTSSATFIEAEEADDGSAISPICVDGTTSGVISVCTNQQINVTTATSAVFTLREQGSLFIAKSTDAPRNRQLLAGAVGESVLKLELLAMDEPIEVRRLVFTNSGTTAVTQSVDSLLLYEEGKSTSFAEATLNDCTSIDNQAGGGNLPANSFCAVMTNKQLVVPVGPRVNIVVRPKMKNDAGGAVSSNTGAIRLMLHEVTDSGLLGTKSLESGTGSVVARGFNSSNDLLRTDGADGARDGEIFVFATPSTTPAADALILGNENDIVLAKIVTIENTNPDANGVAPERMLGARIAQFRFTAATNTQSKAGTAVATLSGIIFNISSTQMDFQNGFALTNAGKTDEIACTTNASGTNSGSFLVQCLAAGNAAVDMDMDSGQSITLELLADFDSQKIGTTTSSLTVSIQDFTVPPRVTAARGTFNMTSTNATHINWTDSLGTSNVKFFDWIESGVQSVSSTNYRI